MLANQICTFETVGGEGSDIKQFKVVDANGDQLPGAVTVQFYNEYGTLKEEYCYYTGKSLDEGYVDGWYDENFDEAKSRPLSIGEGFKSYTSETGAKLIYAGEVDVGAIAIPVPRLLSSTGNIRPSAVHMKDLSVVDVEDTPLPGEVTIQFYNEFGTLKEEYCFYTGESLDVGYVDGWYDENFDEAKDKELAAGEGFCLYTASEGSYLKFPALGAN